MSVLACAPTKILAHDYVAMSTEGQLVRWSAGDPPAVISLNIVKPEDPYHIVKHPSLPLIAILFENGPAVVVDLASGQHDVVYTTEQVCVSVAFEPNRAEDTPSTWRAVTLDKDSVLRRVISRGNGERCETSIVQSPLLGSGLTAVFTGPMTLVAVSGATARFVRWSDLTEQPNNSSDSNTSRPSSVVAELKGKVAILNVLWYPLLDESELPMAMVLRTNSAQLVLLEKDFSKLYLRDETSLNGSGSGPFLFIGPRKLVFCEDSCVKMLCFDEDRPDVTPISALKEDVYLLDYEVFNRQFLVSSKKVVEPLRKVRAAEEMSTIALVPDRIWGSPVSLLTSIAAHSTFEPLTDDHDKRTDTMSTTEVTTSVLLTLALYYRTAALQQEVNVKTVRQQVRQLLMDHNNITQLPDGTLRSMRTRTLRVNVVDVQKAVRALQRIEQTVFPSDIFVVASKDQWKLLANPKKTPSAELAGGELKNIGARMKRFLGRAFEGLETSLVEREEVIRVGFLAVLCREHCFLLGPPGTAKSYAVELLLARIREVYRDPRSLFKIVLHSGSTLDDVIGPYDLGALDDNVAIRTRTGKLAGDGTLFAFLDECFKAQKDLLTVLLSAMNERLYYDGTRQVSIPLHTMFGVSNEIPRAADMGALLDRFLFRAIQPAIADPMVMWTKDFSVAPPRSTVQSLRTYAKSLVSNKDGLMELSNDVEAFAANLPVDAATMQKWASAKATSIGGDGDEEDLLGLRLVLEVHRQGLQTLAFSPTVKKLLAELDDFLKGLDAADDKKGGGSTTDAVFGGGIWSDRRRVQLRDVLRIIAATDGRVGEVHPFDLLMLVYASWKSPDQFEKVQNFVIWLLQDWLHSLPRAEHVEALRVLDSHVWVPDNLWVKIRCRPKPEQSELARRSRQLSAKTKTLGVLRRQNEELESFQTAQKSVDRGWQEFAASASTVDPVVQLKSVAEALQTFLYPTLCDADLWQRLTDSSLRQTNFCFMRLIIKNVEVSVRAEEGIPISFPNNEGDVVQSIEEAWYGTESQHSDNGGKVKQILAANRDRNNGRIVLDGRLFALFTSA